MNLPLRQVAPAPRQVAWLVRMIYPVRSLGLLFALLIIGLTLRDRTVNPVAWMPVLAYTLVWPSVAYLRARRTADQSAAELQNLLVDSFFIGAWLSLLSFSLLPSLFLIVGTHFPNLAVGGARLELRGIVATLAGAALWTAFCGFQLQPEANLAASFVSMLCTLIFVAVVGANAYRINRHYVEARENAERRAVELEHARTAAEAASRAKSQFLAAMSHELRTPMNAIIGFTDLLLRGNHDARQQEQLRHIDAASRSLLALINQVLDLSKIEAGKLELESRAFAPGVMLDKLEALFQSQAAARNLRLHVSRSADLPAAVTGDAMRLEQVLTNLLGNALKFTQAGSIELTVERRGERDGRIVLEFGVRDTGIGISAEQLERLFTPFTQADQSTTRRYGGTGLGLAISKQLIELMGGELSVESRPGEGSTFRFSVPLATADGVPAGEAPSRSAISQLEAARAVRGLRVLLAEDNAMNRRLVGEILGDAGVVLDYAEDGRKALAAVQVTTYDLVLMDMQMPEMDGLEATRAIRALPRFASLPIIAMTANAFEEDRAACVAAGMNDFLAKPIDAEQVLAILAKWAPADGLVRT